MTDCGAPKLDWHGKIYVGSSADQALVGKDNGEIVVIPADDPKFDEMTCTDTFAELQDAYKRLLDKCQKWDR